LYVYYKSLYWKYQEINRAPPLNPHFDFHIDNEAELYTMRDVNISTGQNTYKLMGCSSIK